jgi:alkanesulfonate monooxygenase SsuD/methylene tetrahydromethanopterin reductase-like flavin-dependent oxidoreductase (luciferase family)
MNAAMPLAMAVAARETKNARILALGNPVANRPDPVRVATEMAMIDVVSGGRLDCGFVRSHSYEISATNASPIDMKERLYEAIDLIVKAWTSHDGPFNWEGDFFHHRQVDIVPRPFQQPHPPVWITTVNAKSAREIAERDYIVATIFSTKEACGDIFRAYRQRVAELGRPDPPPERFAYCGFALVADTDDEALRAAPKLQDFLVQSRRTPEGQLDVPGYIDPHGRAAMMRARIESGQAFVAGDAATADPVVLAQRGTAFWGSPDSVFAQLRDFFYAVGGFANFLGMFQASTMSYASTRRSMELFSLHVLPRFREEVYEPWLREHGWKTVVGVADA